MFKGNNNGGTTRSADVNSPDRLNRIVEGTSIQGDIKSDSNIRIDGKLMGTITTRGRVVIGKTGHIEGEIICQNADIEGTLVGKITVDQVLALKSTAKLKGDILTGKLAIEPGANFSGSCNMGGGTKTIQSKPQAQSKLEENASAKVADDTRKKAEVVG